MLQAYIKAICLNYELTRGYTQSNTIKKVLCSWTTQTARLCQLHHRFS